MKRVIIAGGRDFGNRLLPDGSADEAWAKRCKDRLIIECDRLHLHDGDEWQLVCGMAKGADRLGHNWAADTGLKIWEYPADWKTHGKGAGYIRNELMAKNADMLIAFWDGQSRGTKDMILRAVAHGLEIHVFKY